MKKLIALLLAVMMLVTLVACTEKPADTTTKAPVSGNDATAGKPEDTTAAPSKEIVTVKWVDTRGQPQNYDSWMKQVNDYLVENVGVKVELIFVDGETRNMMWQTGADYDIMFGEGSDGIDTMYEAGVLAPLTTALDGVPALRDLIADWAWEAVSYDGEIYGVPAWKDVSHSEYWIWEKAVVDEYYPEYTEVSSLQDCYEALVTIRERGCDWIGFLKNGGFDANGVMSWNYDSVVNGVGISFLGGTEFVSVWEQPDVRANLETVAKIYAEGYINEDCYIADSVEGSEYIVANGWGWPSAAETSWKRDGRDVVVSQFEYTTVSTGSVRGSYLTLNVNSTKIAEALKVIEFLNTDTYMRDLFWYGEEGYNWDYIDDNGQTKVHRYGEEVGREGWTFAAYHQGSFFNVTPQEGSLGYGEIEELNNNAVPSPIMGFAFDKTPVMDQINACSGVWEQYAKMICCGVDITLIDTALEQMYEVGLQDIIDEANRQLKEWRGE